MQAFVINLDRSQDRWRHIEAQLHRMRPDRRACCHRMPAVDGKDADILQKFCDREPWAECVRAAFVERDNPARSGNLACALSHVKAMRTIMALGLDCGVVIEDDTLIEPDLLEVAEEAMQAVEGSLGEDMECPVVIWLSCEWDSRLPVNTEALPLSLDDWTPAYLLRPYCIAEWMNQGNRAYVINQAAARAVQSLMARHGEAGGLDDVPRDAQLWHIDWYMLKMCEDGSLRGFFLRPNVVEIAPMPSVRMNTNHDEAAM